LGHNYGDKLLIQVTKRLRNSIRVNDFIARISGDEFIVLVKGDINKNKFVEIADKIINKISEPYYLTNNKTYISCSLGIAIYPKDGHSSQKLLKHSDLAMYYAKENGKNSFCFYDAHLYENKAKKFILANALRSAISNNELYLVYQPQVDCENNQVNNMEVLLRWSSRQFGPVPVSKFIPLAEESLLILELEDFVLNTALLQVKEWNDTSDHNFCVAINISAIHFAQKDFTYQIESILEKTGFNPNFLELELTEYALMNNTSEVIEKLYYLKSMGIKISIDDFGTGYSSLSYLKKLPVDTLKIDKCFIDGIPEDQNNNAIAKAILELSVQFGLNTIAEGVETREQFEYIKQSGCNLIQGYYFYKPMTAENFGKVFNIH